MTADVYFYFHLEIFNYQLIIIALTTLFLLLSGFSLNAPSPSLCRSRFLHRIHSISHEIQPPYRCYLHCLQCQLTHDIFKSRSCNDAGSWVCIRNTRFRTVLNQFQTRYWNTHYSRLNKQMLVYEMDWTRKAQLNRAELSWELSCPVHLPSSHHGTYIVHKLRLFSY